MSKHTPGPWKTHCGFLGQVYVRGPHDVEVAETSELASSEPLRRVSRAQAEANARLITAAPTMLEALEKAAELGEHDELPSPGTLRDWWAAIAAARGEEVQP